MTNDQQSSDIDTLLDVVSYTEKQYAGLPFESDHNVDTDAVKGIVVGLIMGSASVFDGDLDMEQLADWGAAFIMQMIHEAYNTGYAFGYDDGHGEGYDAGYDDGQEYNN